MKVYRERSVRQRAAFARALAPARARASYKRFSAGWKITGNKE